MTSVSVTPKVAKRLDFFREGWYNRVIKDSEIDVFPLLLLKLIERKPCISARTSDIGHLIQSTFTEAAKMVPS